MGTFVIQLGTMSRQASAAILAVLVLRKFFSVAHISKKVCHVFVGNSVSSVGLSVENQ